MAAAAKARVAADSVATGLVVGLGWGRTRQHGALAVEAPIKRLHLSVELGRLRLGHQLGLVRR